MTSAGETPHSAQMTASWYMTSALSRITDSRFICTASSPTSIASSTSFLAIFCTPSRNSLEVRDAEGLRSRASWTSANSLSSESVMRSDYPYSNQIMPNKSSRSMTKWLKHNFFCKSLGISRGRHGLAQAVRPQPSRKRARSGCERSEKRPSVCAADQGVDQVFWMGHQTQHIEPVVEHARYRIDGAVRARTVPDAALSVAIAKRDPAFRLDPADGVVVGDEVSLAVGNGEFDHLSRRIATRERSLRVLDPDMLHFADEAQLRIAHQNAGQKAGLAQDLEAIADAKHQSAARRVIADRSHDRRSRRDRAAAQIIAVGESTRQDDQIDTRRQLVFGMPDDCGLGARGLTKRARDVAFAINSRKQDDRRSHGAYAISMA